jgi:chromosome segregation protein
MVGERAAGSYTSTVHLSSLTLRGFKSFADKTTLHLEPGVTVIIGPNGSGKSNVVDALTWVLGTQSPRSLRGGAMSDVIFAGAPGRPALGRAAVEITIDNADGAVPLDFSEITIGRAMFASGETEYTINGESCRQLDVAELLSDAGLGRDSHTIVSQGQLDIILSARPEERRAFIDEAAGITKHRKRKDRAVRKLEQMQEHAGRLQDVARELKRGLRPLERQAEAAARHDELSTRLRGVRMEYVTDELVSSAREHARLVARHRDLSATAEELGRRLQALRSEEAHAERALTTLRPRVEMAASTHFRLANTVERLRAVRTQIAERRRGLLTALDEPVMLRDPAELRQDAAVERAALEDVEREVAIHEQELASAAAHRQNADRARRAYGRAAAADARRRAAARERRLRWEGEVAALRSALAQAASEQGRLDGRLAALRERQQRCAADVTVTEQACNAIARRRDEHEQAAGAADAVVDACRDELDELMQAEHTCERQRAVLAARVEALAAAVVQAPDGTRGVLDAQLDGVLGHLADHIKIHEGYERAVVAALGSAAEALVTRDPRSAAHAATVARDRGDGRVRLLAGRNDAPPAVTTRLPAGVRLVADLFDGRPEVVAALRVLLRDAAVVNDYAAACALTIERPELTVVTTSGEVAGAGGYVVGGAAATSTVEQQAALAATRVELAELDGDAQAIADRVANARRTVEEAERTRASVVSEYKTASATLAERTQQLRRLQAEAAAYARELGAVEQAADQLDTEVAKRRVQLQALERIPHEPADEASDEGPDLEAERLDDTLRVAQEAEVDARVAVSSARSRRDEITRRIVALDRDIDQLEKAWTAADLRQQRRRVAVQRCKHLGAIAQQAVEAGEAALEASALERLRLEDQRDEQQRALGVARSRVAMVEHQLADHTRIQHADELAVADAGHKLEDARGRARDLGLDPGTLLADGADVEPLSAQRRATLADDEERLARELALLGPVNPLAVDEFEALKERQRFLTEQLDDLERSRRDLLEMVDAVDERIRQIFAAAFADVAAEFQRFFAVMFPGGEGRLMLTDPDDMLHTGIDVEARPPGKRVKRLSLLSGGERSLVALAVAFAIFAARPSPFYVLDEVEAALDDINLQRVLDVIAEFRASSQLIVVTHQKRTMEIADVLYGVTMRSGGVSKVLSQRLTDVA